MKTNLVKSAVLMASFSATLIPASAETLRATIPFGFSAGGIAMPGGAYSISTMPGAPSVLLFENETTKTQAIVFVRPGNTTPAEPAAPLTFTSGDRTELANIVTGVWRYELSVHPARKSVKGAALAITSAAK